MEKYFLKGLGGQLRIEENFVIIERKGTLSLLNHGMKGAKRIPIKSITAVQLKKAGIATSGYIQFSFSGGKESKSGLFSASQDENTVMFERKYNDLALEIRDYIEDQLVNSADQSVGVQAPSAADEILKYANLMDQGIITEDEFNKKKAELLGL